MILNVEMHAELCFIKLLYNSNNHFLFYMINIKYSKALNLMDQSLFHDIRRNVLFFLYIFLPNNS